jgi:LacI family transcriptional regulator
MFAHSDRDVMEENRLMREMSQDGVRGFLLWPTLADDQPRFLQGNTLPAVLMDRHIPGLSYPCVSADHYQGAVQAIQHLIALGHTEIAFVARPHLQLTSIADRLRGYEDMMRKAGLRPLPPVIVGVERELSTPRAQPVHEQDREDEIKQLQAVLKQKDRLTALFAMNDLMALLILRAAEAAGVKIPDEVSLVGFDDLDLVSQVKPPLTTVKQDPWEIGQVSARILLDMIGGTPPTAQTILLPTHLIVRSSTASR